MQHDPAIIAAIVADTHPEINPETYVMLFQPCARQRVAASFDHAERRGLIAAIRTARSGQRIYKLADWLKLDKTRPAAQWPNGRAAQ